MRSVVTVMFAASGGSFVSSRRTGPQPWAAGSITRQPLNEPATAAPMPWPPPLNGDHLRTPSPNTNMVLRSVPTAAVSAFGARVASVVGPATSIAATCRTSASATADVRPHQISGARGIGVEARQSTRRRTEQPAPLTSSRYVAHAAVPMS